MNFPSTSKNLEKLGEVDKVSKRKSSQQVGDCPIANIDSNSLKSTILSLNLLTKKYDYYELPKFSSKQVGPLKSFSYNTFQGLFKDYNEDRVSVCSLVKKPSSSKMKTWPKISYFAIFDGHGGEEPYLRFVNSIFPDKQKSSLIIPHVYPYRLLFHLQEL